MGAGHYNIVFRKRTQVPSEYLSRQRGSFEDTCEVFEYFRYLKEVQLWTLKIYVITTIGSGSNETKSEGLRLGFRCECGALGRVM